MEPQMYPIAEQNRIASLDVMRGLAIFGIYLVNMLSFHSPYMFIDPLAVWDKGLDRMVYIFIDVFAQASFYPLFSMLFGYGLVLQRERAALRGAAFPPLAARRLGFLLLAGIIHAFFIWPGDILITYALIGFLALFFLRMGGKALLSAGIAMYIIPNLLLGLLILATELLQPGIEYTRDRPGDAAAALEAYGSGSFREATAMRAYEWLQMNNLENAPVLLFSLLPLFLIGAGVAKLKWLENPVKIQGKLVALSAAAFAMGIFLKIFPYIRTGGYTAEFFQDFFGGPLLAIAYAGLTAVLVHKFGTGKGFLASTGRVSMTNYLFQSLFSTLLFFGYGGGLYGRVSLFQGTLLVLVVFIFQAGASRIWLKRFRFGPVEWVWRSVTYGKAQGLKKEGNR